MTDTSRRDYVTAAEVYEMAGITPTAVDISEAEEIIDDYVGFQDKFMQIEFRGLISEGGANNVRLDPRNQSNLQANFLKRCWIEIIGGTGEGQKMKIITQTLSGYITLESNFTTPLDTTSYYFIWQLGKFPRTQDVEYDGLYTNKYYKNIPEAVKRATAAQVQYMSLMGDNFFGNDKPDMENESIGDYSYTNRGSSTGTSKLIAPKARLLLLGIANKTGIIL